MHPIPPSREPSGCRFPRFRRPKAPHLKSNTPLPTGRPTRFWYGPEPSGQSRTILAVPVANDESQAVLHLAAALQGRAGTLPAFTGAEPFIHTEYGNSNNRLYDTERLYRQAR